MDLYLNPTQIKAMIKQAQKEDETIIIRCIRKGPASKVGGPDTGDLYDLACVAKPPYIPKTVVDRKAEDRRCGVFTVFVNNRRDKNGNWGAWRRINIKKVQKVVYKGMEYEVVVNQFQNSLATTGV